MPLSYVPGHLANAFEGVVIEELARLDEDVGRILHNVLLPHVRNRYRPDEHDVLLLLPWAAYTIDAKEYEAGDYRIPGNGIVEWRALHPEYSCPDEPGVFREVPQLPNPFQVAHQKCGVLHSLLAKYLGPRFASYSVESLIVVPDHAHVEPNEHTSPAIERDPLRRLRVTSLSRLRARILEDKPQRSRPGHLSAEEIDRILDLVGAKATPSYLNVEAHICGHRVEDQVERYQPASPVTMRAYKARLVVDSRPMPRPVEIRIYHRWPWNDDSRRFLRHLQRHLTACYGHALPGIPYVQVHEFPDIVIVISEWFEGRTLAEVVAQRGFLSATLVRDLLIHFAGTIASLHDRGVGFLDLRPETILVRQDVDSDRGQQHRFISLVSPLIDEQHVSTQAMQGYDASFVADALLYTGHPDRDKSQNDLFSLGRIAAFCILGREAYCACIDARDGMVPGAVLFRKISSRKARKHCSASSSRCPAIRNLSDLADSSNSEPAASNSRHSDAVWSG